MGDIIDDLQVLGDIECECCGKTVDSVDSDVLRAATPAQWSWLASQHTDGCEFRVAVGRYVRLVQRGLPNKAAKARNALMGQYNFSY